MTDTTKQRGLAVLVLVGLIAFLYQMMDVISKIQSWEVLWNPPTVAGMLGAVIAGLVAVVGAMGLDVPALIKGFKS